MVAGGVCAERERRIHVLHLADRAFCDQLGQAHDLRVEAVHERLSQVPAVAPGRLDDRHRARVVDGERLLAHDVLAGTQSLDREAHVLGVHRRDVDGVDLGVGEEVCVGLVHADAAGRALEFGSERARAVRAAAGDRHQLTRAAVR